MRQLQAMPPIFLRDACRMDFPAANFERLAVEQKIVGADRERVRFGGETADGLSERRSEKKTGKSRAVIMFLRPAA